MCVYFEYIYNVTGKRRLLKKVNHLLQSGSKSIYRWILGGNVQISVSTGHLKVHRISFKTQKQGNNCKKEDRMAYIKSFSHLCYICCSLYYGFSIAEQFHRVSVWVGQTSIVCSFAPSVSFDFAEFLGILGYPSMNIDSGTTKLGQQHLSPLAPINSKNNDWFFSF